ncbi:ATP-binding protein [Thalassomonas viridans]|uniref:ATP-binding protein n=1 Tax=Thalassomonas viridans TaxID=137584 RepID=A0AAE9YYS9_9GAMM|nr:ATP-binding protein [Thalassomonas viridans]WDE02915.1 ATP-binding protein [Thalassomonas viridans]
MAIFDFDSARSLIGTVRDVDTRKVSVHVKSDEDLRKAKVGQLVCLETFSGVDAWLVAIVEKVTKSVSVSTTELMPEEGIELEGAVEDVINTVKVSLVGSVKWDAVESKAVFTRSLMQVPDIDAQTFVLIGKDLEAFMNILVSASDTEHSLELGSYIIDEKAQAFLDGNKFFQRHAALVGSTGSGKSWTVASILERAARLPSSNLIVFDLHGEYKSLSYAKQLRIPGPEELGVSNNELLYLPYWLLNADEMQSMFIDSSSFSAQNQVSKFQEAVVDGKKKTLRDLGKRDVLDAFTLDSPIPFEINDVVADLRYLNEQMVPGAKAGTEKKGPFNGAFDRLIARLQGKLDDRRYGFLFQAPVVEHSYDALGNLVSKLMNFENDKEQIKVIDFSEVPSDILPVMVGLVGRLIYQIQFWTDQADRHPIAMVCDEAHLYLPKKDGRNPIEKRAIESFEKIAKEGRKYGVALFIVSQRPSDVSTTILSQCSNVISLRLTNAEDQSTVKKLLPDSLDSLLDILPIMDIGEALVVGDSVLLPSRIKITPPKEQPLSGTVKFWDRWSIPVSNLDFMTIVENLRKQSRN